MSWLLLSIPILLAGALLCVGLRNNRAASCVALASQSLASGSVLAGCWEPLWRGSSLELSWSWARPIQRVAFRLDALSAFFLAWSVPLTLLGTLYAVGYLRGHFSNGRHGGPHFALLNLVSLSFVLIYSSQNALVFLLGWEIAAVAAWLLVIWDYRNQKIRFAGFNYLVSTHVGLFVLVAAFMLLHSQSGSMDFRDFGRVLAQRTPLRGTLFLLLGVAFALKSAFFPFHTWLPRAHSAAPAHVSALMSGVIHKAGLFAFLRFTLLQGTPDEWMGWSVLAVGALSALFGVLFTSTQRDLKRLLGYSSTENVGIVALGFGVGYLGWCWRLPGLALCGFAGGLLHLFNHALFKCLLFYGAGSVYQASHTVDLERLGGLAKRLPLTAALFLFGAVAICGLPPLNGFVSEVILYSGLLAGNAPDATSRVVLTACAALLAFVGAVGALAMIRAFGVVFLGQPREATGAPHEAPPSMLLPMTIHALAALGIGLVPSLGLSLVRSSVRLFPVAPDFEATLMPLAPFTQASRLLAGALLVLGAWAWFSGRNARRDSTWGCGYSAATPRMQYTGSSFSEQFARLFASFMPSLRRERLLPDLFPQQPGHVATHHPDPVERRMFEVIGRGEELIRELASRLPEEPRFAFAAGFLTLLAIGAWLLAVQT